MVALPVWIESWVCQCCGVRRRVGERVDLALTFAGDVAGSTDPDRIDVLPEGKVRLVGSVTGRVDDAHADKAATLVQSGNVQIAFPGMPRLLASAVRGNSGKSGMGSRRARRRAGCSISAGVPRCAGKSGTGALSSTGTENQWS